MRVQKNIQLIQRSFWWPGLSQNCKDYVGSCALCLHNKGSNTKAWGLLRPLPIPDLPWKMLSMGFIVDLPPAEGFTSIFVVIDHLSKMSHFVPMVGTPSSADMVHAFIKEIVRLHGLPRSIVSDRGVQFTSKFWRILCKALNIDVCLSSAYHLQSNGQI